MVVGSKFHLKSLNLDDFTISVDSDKLLLATQAKYSGLWVSNDLNWDDHILELCRKMYYYFHMFRRLRKIVPSFLLLNIYESRVQYFSLFAYFSTRYGLLALIMNFSDMHPIKQLDRNINSVTVSCVLSWVPHQLSPFFGSSSKSRQKTWTILKDCVMKNAPKLIWCEPRTVYALVIKTVMMLLICQISCVYGMCNVRIPLSLYTQWNGHFSVKPQNGAVKLL